MDTLEEILKRFDMGDGADVFERDCPVHGLTNALCIINQGGHDCTYACLECVAELHLILQKQGTEQGDQTPEQQEIVLLTAFAEYINQQYPQLEAKLQPEAPGVYGILIKLSEVQAVFIRKDVAWCGQVEDLGAGGQRDFAFDFNIGLQPTSPDAATVGDSLITAIGYHMLRHNDYHVGERVELIHGVDRFPYFTVPAGRQGTIREVNAETMTVSVQMDDQIEGAEEWQNCIIWDVEHFHRFPLEAKRTEEPTGSQRFVFMLSCGEKEHSYGEPEITDYEWVDNGAFKGYRVGLQRICSECGNVSQGTKGIAKEELSLYQRAKFLIRFNGTKMRINWEGSGKGVNTYSTPEGTKHLCIEDAAAAYGNEAQLLGSSERGTRCEKCGAISNGAGTSTYAESPRSPQSTTTAPEN